MFFELGSFTFDKKIARNPLTLIIRRQMKLNSSSVESASIRIALNIFRAQSALKRKVRESKLNTVLNDERGDVPGWVLVVLMTTGLVTAIWTIASPRLSAILKNSLDSMNGIR